MKKYEVDVLWTMIVPTKFSKVIYANSEEGALEVAKKAANCFDFEDWRKGSDLDEDIYSGDYYGISVTEVK